MNKKILNVTLAIFLSGTALSVNAAPWKFTDLGSLGGTSFANGINNSGQVVGVSFIASTPYATLWSGNSMTTLGGLGGDGSQAYEINDAGQVVGYSTTTGNVAQHATIWNGVTPTDLGVTPGWANSYAYAINNIGQVAGMAWNGNPQATLWNGTAPIDLGALGVHSGNVNAINNSGLMVGYSTGHATMWNGNSQIDLGMLPGIWDSSEAKDVNDAGQIVGGSWLDGSIYAEATLWDGNDIIGLGDLGPGTFGGGFSHANAINNNGQVVGLSRTDSRSHAFLWDDNKLFDLNDFLDEQSVSDGWVLASAQDINDKGWIVGYAVNVESEIVHAFLLTPVPEPETYAMILAGLGLVGFVSRCRKTS